jgi:hypothetical protein
MAERRRTCLDVDRRSRGPEGAVAICRGPLSVDVVLRPFSLTLRRDGRRLLRSAGLWAAEGSAADHFADRDREVTWAER